MGHAALTEDLCQSARIQQSNFRHTWEMPSAKILTLTAVLAFIGRICLLSRAMGFIASVKSTRVFSLFWKVIGPLIPAEILVDPNPLQE